MSELANELEAHSHDATELGVLVHAHLDTILAALRPAPDEAVVKLRSDIFAVLRRHNVSEQCFAEIAMLTHAALSPSIEQVRGDEGWQDIASAPKDGTVFLAYSQDLTGSGLSSFISLCAWHPDGGFCTDELREPTHFRPLPPPPAIRTGDSDHANDDRS